MSKRKRRHHPKDRSERRSYRKAAKATLKKPWEVLATRVNKHGEKKKKSKNDKRNLQQETKEGLERFFNPEIAD
jgi:hypothetical protein